MQTKIGRHLEAKHGNESLLQNLSQLDKNKKERDIILDRVRLLGDFYYNVKVLKNGGELIVCRRPSPGEKLSASKFGPCKYCLGFFHKEELWRHARNCLYKGTTAEGEDLESIRNIQQEADILLHGQKDPDFLELEEFVIQRMRKDEITTVAASDEIIKKYGNFLMSGKGSKKANSISSNMRLMARLLITLRKNDNNSNKALKDFMKPVNFDLIVKCTKEMAGFSQKNSDGEFLPTFKIPSLPLKIGFALSSIFMLLKGLALRIKEPEVIEDATNLSQLYASEWSNLVSSASLRTIADTNFNKQEFLPVTSDLLKVKAYCYSKMEALVAELKKAVDKQLWRELAEIVITRLTIFNKRRGNEVSSILLKWYKNRADFGKALHDDVLESLSALERKLMERFFFYLNLILFKSPKCQSDYKNSFLLQYQTVRLTNPAHT